MQHKSSTSLAQIEKNTEEEMGYPLQPHSKCIIAQKTFLSAKGKREHKTS